MDRFVFVTARTASTRLPGKCLMEVSPGVPAIMFLVNRLSKHGYIVILCTSDSSNDDKLASVVASSGQAIVFRGSEDDKLKRWLDCAHRYNVGFFVTADGDDLLVDLELIDMAFWQYRNHWHSFINSPNTPSGSFSWGIETKSLERVYNANISDNKNTEMGWAWFDNVFEIDNIPSDLLRKDIRMTLDYEEDLLFFKYVIKEVGNGSLRDIINFLDLNRWIADINIAREGDWKANQNKLVQDIT